MIIPDLKSYPTITVSLKPSEWSKESVKSSLESLVSSMELVASQNHKFELFIQGNVDVKNTPPLYVFTMLVKALLKNRELLKNNLLCSAIYIPSKPNAGLKNLIDHVLNLYQPTRPLKKFEDHQKAVAWIMQQRQLAHQNLQQQNVT